MKVVMDAPTLPFGLKDSDLQYPKRPKRYDWHKPHGSDLMKTITLYETERFGWVVCTLEIRRPGRRHRHDAQPRTYGIDRGGKICTVGLGPHVKRSITVYVSRARAEALKELTDLHRKGLADAGSIRDRISSRRAFGALWRMDRGY